MAVAPMLEAMAVAVVTEMALVIALTLSAAVGPVLSAVAPTLVAAAGAVAEVVVPTLAAAASSFSGVNGVNADKNGVRKNILLQGLERVTLLVRIKITTNIIGRKAESDKLIKHRRY